MKLFFKFLIVLITLILLSMVFSYTEEKYKCEGTLLSNDISKKVNLFFVHMKYRFWVHLWNKSDGQIQIEIPDAMFQFSNYFYLNNSINIIEISESEYKPEIIGTFSTLSNSLNLKIYDDKFKGECIKIDK